MSIACFQSAMSLVQSLQNGELVPKLEGSTLVLQGLCFGQTYLVAPQLYLDQHWCLCSLEALIHGHKRQLSEPLPSTVMRQPDSLPPQPQGKVGLDQSSHPGLSLPISEVEKASLLQPVEAIAGAASPLDDRQQVDFEPATVCPTSTPVLVHSLSSHKKCAPAFSQS